MGVYDRDYYREQRPGVSLHAPRTVVGMLILANIAVLLANMLLSGAPDDNAIANALSVHGDTLTKPYLWWQLLTYGFVHAPNDFSHILFNMIGLWLFGRPVEAIYGSKEFLRLYLALLVAGSLVWAVGNLAAGGGANVQLVGASGAVVGIVILFALHYPRQTFLLMFVLPMPAWLLGVLLVLGDLLGAINRGGSNVAYTVHLAGAALAYAYYRSGWRLTGLLASRLPRLRLRRRPKLRIHDPSPPGEDLGAEVDRILKKIHTSGEGSLTRKERRTLEDASREYQRRRQG